MKTISPLVFDFNNLEVTFEMARKKVTLTGSLEFRECKQITGKRMRKMLQQEEGMEAQLYSAYAVELENGSQRGRADEHLEPAGGSAALTVSEVESLGHIITGEEFKQILKRLLLWWKGQGQKK